MDAIQTWPGCNVELVEAPKVEVTTEFLPCPFCGKTVDLEDGDTLHPSGTGWKDDEVEGFRTYHSFRDVPKEQWCWEMNCPTPACGCGANITGDSKEEAIAAWNRRPDKIGDVILCLTGN